MDVAGAKDSHVPSMTPAGEIDLPGQIRVFGPSPPYPYLGFTLDEHYCRTLLKQGRVKLLRTSSRIRGVRISEEPPKEKQKRGPIRGRSVGQPTAKATLDNATGVWTFDAPVFDESGKRKPATSLDFRGLPAWVEEYLFRTVILDCSSKRAA